MPMHVLLKLMLSSSILIVNFRSSISVSNSLDPDRDRHSVGLDGSKLFAKIILVHKLACWLYNKCIVKNSDN